MVPIESFLSRLLPQVPACPEPYAVQALLDSAIEFCSKALVIRENSDVTVVAAGDPLVDIGPPTGDHMIVRLLSLTVNGSPIQAIQQEDVSNLNLNNVGQPTAWYTTRDFNILQVALYPTPDKPVEVVANYALAPTRTATSVDDDLLNYWSDAIIEGALARICQTPNQPFTDGRFAAGMRQSFLQKLYMAKSESYYGRLRGNLTVRMRPFA